MTKILIVEDEEHISKLIAMALSPLGYIWLGGDADDVAVENGLKFHIQFLMAA